MSPLVALSKMLPRTRVCAYDVCPHYVACCESPSNIQMQSRIFDSSRFLNSTQRCPIEIHHGWRMRTHWGANNQCGLVCLRRLNSKPCCSPLALRHPTDPLGHQWPSNRDSNLWRNQLLAPIGLLELAHTPMTQHGHATAISLLHPCHRETELLGPVHMWLVGATSRNYTIQCRYVARGAGLVSTILCNCARTSAIAHARLLPQTIWLAFPSAIEICSSLCLFEATCQFQ